MYTHLKIVPIFIAVILTAIACKEINKDPYPIDQTLTKSEAMIVSAHPLASKAGVEILKKGGNAVDAAIAVQFTLAVVYPRAGNLGGGGFMLIRDNKGNAEALDYREMAPGKSGRDMYLNKDLDVIDSLSRYGSLAIGVPGSVRGLYEAWKKYGSVNDFSLLLEDAVQLAKDGFLLNKDEADRLNRYRDDFIKFNKHPIAFVKAEDWKTGDLLVQKDLAKTLALIKNEGPDVFYSGSIAMKIDSQMRKDNGIITKEDLSSYQAIWRELIESTYHEYNVMSMPPPSSGGVALGQLLKILEKYDLKNMGFQSDSSIHLIAEAERRVYADRAKHLGDNDFYPVPVNALLDSAYLSDRMLNFDWERSTSSDSIDGGNNKIQLESFETTHTSVVDRDRMAVSVTTTLNSNYGSKVLVDGAGFLLNNEMDDFSVKPGVPNQFGLIGGKANEIQAGKRMLSSMTPTIIEKNDSLFMVLGSPGGSTIITSVLQVFLNVADFGMNMSEAVAAPRFHHQWLPDNIIIEENRFDSLLINKLKAKGHKFESYNKIGLVKAILVNEDGRLEGAGDPRSFDDAEGY